MDTTYQWIDFEQIGVEGRGWEDRESPYDRLPRHAKEKICNFSQAVWDLSHSSTGMCITFWTDSTEIRVRRELALPQLNEYNFNSCAFSGFDLYGEYKLDELIARITAETNIPWIRILYCYPDKITDGLCKQFAENDRLVKYIDIPIQLFRRGGSCA